MRLFLLLFLVTLCAQATDKFERLEFTINSEKNNDKLGPSMFLPYYFNDNLYSGFGYVNRSRFVVTDINADTYDARYNTHVDYEKIWFDVLNYRINLKDASFTVGASVEYENFNTLQFGYTEFNDPSFPLVINDIKKQYEYYSLGLYSDYSMQKIADIFSFRVGMYLYPAVYQSTKETQSQPPLISQEASVSYQAFEDIRYRLFFTSQIEITHYFAILIDLKYSKDGYSPQVLVPRQNGTDFYFDVSDTKDVAYKSESILRFLFPSLSMYEINPTIGIGYINEDVTSKYDGTTTNTNSNRVYYSFGIVRAF